MLSCLLPSFDLNIQSSLTYTRRVEIRGREEGDVALLGEDMSHSGLFLRRTTKWSREGSKPVCGLKQVVRHAVLCMAGVKRKRRTRV